MFQSKIAQFAIIVAISASCNLYASIKSTTGTILFDSNNDGVSEMTLNTTGLGIGIVPAANLYVSGNAIITGDLFIGSSNNTSNSNLHINGTIGYSSQSFGPGSNTISGSSFVLADTSLGNVVLQLPDAATLNGQKLVIKRTSNLNSLILSGSGNTMDGYSTIYFPSGNYNSISVMSNGSTWYVLENNNSDSLVEVANSNILTWWKLDETSGNTASDASNNSRSGNLSNSHLFSGNSVTGALGTALKLDDFDDRLLYEAGSLPTAAYTYSLWVKSTNNASDTIDYDPDIEGVAGFIWASSNTTHHKSAYHQLSDSSYVSTAISSALNANTWYHIGVTWDGSELEVFLNGTKESGNTSATSWSTASNIMLSHPGTFNSGAVTIDDLRVYNKALDAFEVNALYLSGQP